MDLTKEVFKPTKNDAMNMIANCALERFEEIEKDLRLKIAANETQIRQLKNIAPNEGMHPDNKAEMIRELKAAVRTIVRKYGFTNVSPLKKGDTNEVCVGIVPSIVGDTISEVINISTYQSRITKRKNHKNRQEKIAKIESENIELRNKQDEIWNRSRQFAGLGATDRRAALLKTALEQNKNAVIALQNVIDSIVIPQSNVVEAICNG